MSAGLHSSLELGSSSAHVAVGRAGFLVAAGLTSLPPGHQPMLSPRGLRFPATASGPGPSPQRGLCSVRATRRAPAAALTVSAGLCLRLPDPFGGLRGPVPSTHTRRRKSGAVWSAHLSSSMVGLGHDLHELILHFIHLHFSKY